MPSPSTTGPRVTSITSATTTVVSTGSSEPRRAHLAGRVPLSILPHRHRRDRQRRRYFDRQPRRVRLQCPRARKPRQHQCRRLGRPLPACPTDRHFGLQDPGYPPRQESGRRLRQGHLRAGRTDHLRPLPVGRSGPGQRPLCRRPRRPTRRPHGFGRQRLRLVDPRLDPRDDRAVRVGRRRRHVLRER